MSTRWAAEAPLNKSRSSFYWIVQDGVGLGRHNQPIYAAIYELESLIQLCQMNAKLSLWRREADLKPLTGIAISGWTGTNALWRHEHKALIIPTWDSEEES